ncbi:Redoxin [Flagelloscypha sp. PMI_526]|nr:Redoxin [Flagelloscypha sp. PMI_526]
MKIGVPGAFSGTCHAQIPRYVEAYDKLKAKGITEFYVVAVNDYFTMNAWKKSFEIPENKPITFIADDKSNLVSALGLLFDATPVFGGPRSKRFVIIAEGGKAKNIFVEGNPSEVTVTAPEEILAFLV